MSMNLECTEVDLWQTPTTITYMCISLNDKGKPDGGWRGVRNRYITWVRGTLNGAWPSEQMLKDRRELVEDHVAELLSHNKLHFSVV